MACTVLQRASEDNVRHFAIVMMCAVVGMTSGAQAECLWNDKPDLAFRFQTFVTKSMPRFCGKPKFGYQSLYSTEPGQLKYEINVITNRLCFAGLGRNLRALQRQNALIKCKTNMAREVRTFPNAGSGKAIIFTFKATAPEIQDAQGN